MARMINFNNLTKDEIDTSILKNLGERILKDQGINYDEEINCIFTDNEHIKQLNGKYLGRNFPTDVLAFSFLEGDDSGYRKTMFGDIYISVDVAKSNAKRYGQNLIEEIKLLFVHGLLHLLGYDDKDEKEKEIMKGKEKYYLNQ